MNPPDRTGSKERPYHHGDLRSALLAHAHRILREEGLEGLTLRAVARAAGVSQAAPYRHFPDRRALMAAVASEGFEQLHQAMGQAMSEGGGRQGFKGIAIAYVRFARANPALYRVMFGAEVANTSDLPELASTSRAALGFVQGGLEQLQAAGLVRQGDAAVMAVALWASLHGVAALILDGQAETVTDIDTLVEAVTTLVMFGLAPRPGGPGTGTATPAG